MRRPLWLAAVFALLAVGCAATVSDKDRAGARIRYDMGVAAMKDGDMLGALRELLAAVKVSPDMAMAHNALGLVFHAIGRREDALKHYDEAVRLAPKFSEAHNNRGVLLTDLGRYDDAILSFDLALADILYATPLLAEGNMGWAYFKKGDLGNALQHLQNAVATNPKFCKGYAWLAEVSLDSKKPEQTVAYCRRFQKQCLDDPAIAGQVPEQFTREMSYYLGRGYLESGDEHNAREAFDACVKGGLEDELAAKCAQLRASLE